VSQNNKYTNYSTVDARYDVILKGSDLKDGELSLSAPWEVPLHWNGNADDHIDLGSMVKADSVGTKLYQSGTDDLKIWSWEIGKQISLGGYYKTSDGKNVIVVEEYFSDRATGEIQKIGIPIYLARLLSEAEGRYNGVINLSSLAPVTGNDQASTMAGTAVTIDVLANDRDPDGDRLVVDGLTQPVHGKVVVSEDGSLIYAPDHGFLGQEQFTYWASDNNGNFTRATVLVNVEAHGDAILQ
jgi:hypothetical protein